MINRCSAFFLCTAVSFLEAQVTVLDQTRLIQVTTSVDGVTRSASATDFGPFEALVTHSVPFSINGITGLNSGYGFISCHFENGVKGRQRLRGQGLTGEQGVVATATVRSTIDVTFRVDVHGPYYILTRGEGVVHAAAERLTYQLRRVQDGHLVVSDTFPTLVGQTLHTGELAPGEYRFTYTSNLVASGEQSDRDMRFEFVFDSPPCAADFNLDGSVDGSDVEAFFMEWEEGDAEADVNFDGGVDGNDIMDFFIVWEAGGC